TYYFFCADGMRLEAIEARLYPGSIVSFYFDDRIQCGPYFPGLRATYERIPSNPQYEPVIGVLEEAGIEIEVLNGYYGHDLDEEDWEWLVAGSCVFYGEESLDKNDGVNAVTLILPDADGIVRAHPH